MKPLLHRPILLASAALLGGTVSAVNLSVSQGGAPAGTFAPYAGGTTAAVNYNYFDSEAHLAVGPALSSGRAHLFFFEGTDGLHFNVVFNDGLAGGGGSGSANWSFALTGNGSSHSVRVSDDSGELSGSTGNWNWAEDFTDGGVIGPISGSAWSLTITASSHSLSGIAVYGGGGKVIPLSLGTGGANAIVITPVPEPAQAALAAAALLGGLAVWRQTRSRLGGGC